MANKGPEINKSYEQKEVSKKLPEANSTPEYKKTMDFLKKAVEKMPKDEKSLAFERKGYKVGIYPIENKTGYAVLLTPNEPNSNNFLKVKYMPNGLVKVSEITLKKEGKVEKDQDNPRVVGNAVQKVFEVLKGSSD